LSSIRFGAAVSAFGLPVQGRPAVEPRDVLRVHGLAVRADAVARELDAVGRASNVVVWLCGAGPG
jgi:hypothetical protein